MVVDPGESKRVLVVMTGELMVASECGRYSMRRDDWVVVPKCGLTVEAIMPYRHGPAAECMIIDGRWDEIYEINMFRIGLGPEIELHYHDYHEYWMIYRGHGKAITEGAIYEVGPGDVVATAAGYEHGMESPGVIVEGVTMETRPMGRGRVGHLHRHEHGDPVPIEPQDTGPAEFADGI
jgi:mannose-6-phosphate isomerase-like protein (cupin superfamily)